MSRLLKILKVLGYSLGGLFAMLNIGLGIAIIAWYGMIFYPYQDQIDKRIQHSQAELGNDTKQLQVLTKLNYYPSDLYKIAAMKSYDYFYKGHHRSRLEGSLARSIWSIGIKLNYTEEQIFHLSTALGHYKWANLVSIMPL
ncbi:MAG TPA: hypothetical protein PLM98_15455 [Thiolinea sp.]|nr:hypothetical protein [Thiolinea sp.]